MGVSELVTRECRMLITPSSSTGMWRLSHFAFALKVFKPQALSAFPPQMIATQYDLVSKGPSWLLGSGTCSRLGSSTNNPGALVLPPKNHRRFLVR